jgi:hypothetical protein
MKSLLLIIFSLSSSILFGQTFRDIDEGLNQFITTNIKSESSIFWIKSILNNRDTSYLMKQVNNFSGENIKIVEVFDSKTKAYGIKEAYAVNGKVEFIYKDKSVDTFYNSFKKNYKYPFTKVDTLKSSIVYFPPNTVEAMCGCGQVPVKIRRRCIKKAENQAKKDSFTSEHFARLITYVDKTNGHINFVLELPTWGQRKVSYGISPDIDNRRWYD